jgi:sorting nexin-8
LKLSRFASCNEHVADVPTRILQSQRDLYIAARDLFIRHDRLSGDQVDRLKKRIEVNGSKLEGVKAAQKEGWEVEVDKLASLIERDQAMISTLLNRRVFIRLR